MKKTDEKSEIKAIPVFFSKSNTLITSKSRMTLVGRKIADCAIMNAKECVDEYGMPAIRADIDGDELKAFLGADYGSLYDKVKELCNVDNRPQNATNPCLLDWAIIVKDDVKQKFDVIKMFPRAHFENGRLSIYFNNALKKNVIGLKKNFTMLDRNITSGLSSNYSYQLYQIFKQTIDRETFINKTSGPFELSFDLVDLKVQLGTVDAASNSILNKAVTNDKINSYDCLKEIELSVSEKIRNIEEKHDTVSGSIKNFIEQIVKNTKSNDKKGKDTKIKLIDYKDFSAALKNYDKEYLKDAEELFKTYKDLILVKTLKEVPNFKRYAIDKAKTELNEKTDINVEYEKIGKGRGGKCVGFKFIIQYKEVVVEESAPQQKEVDIFEFIDEMRSFMKDVNFSIKDLNNIAETANYDMNKVKNAYKILVSPHNEEIKNATGFMMDAIRNNYEPPITVSKKNSYNNFEQNTYDYDELENSLRSN